MVLLYRMSTVRTVPWYCYIECRRCGRCGIIISNVDGADGSVPTFPETRPPGGGRVDMGGRQERGRPAGPRILAPRFAVTVAVATAIMINPN